METFPGDLEVGTYEFGGRNGECICGLNRDLDGICLSLLKFFLRIKM